MTLLHLVPATETRASSGVLMSRCLSTLQELVGRNGLPFLLLSQIKQVLSLNYFCFNECELMNVMLILYDRRVSQFSNVNVSVYQQLNLLMKNKDPLCFSTSGFTRLYSNTGVELQKDDMMIIQNRMIVNLQSSITRLFAEELSWYWEQYFSVQFLLFSYFQ